VPGKRRRPRAARTKLPGVRGRQARIALALVLLVLASLLLVGGAQAAPRPYAPLDRPGPALDVPAAKLRAAFSCTSGVSNAKRNPILLVPGTSLDPKPNYSWNYERAFKAKGWPYCTITLPFHTQGDAQVSGEYLVYALRTMHARAGRKVDILGFSQGGMLPRWAFRWWPDVRRLVNDAVGLDPSNHGTVFANGACQGQGSCSPAGWQQTNDSHFIDALNSRAETFHGIDYTIIFSRADEIVVPNFDDSGSSSLHTGRGRIANIAVQEICPNDTSDHLAMGSYDAVGYALAIDAFTHAGTADKSRIPPSVCGQPFHEGVNGSTFAGDYAGYVQAIGDAQSDHPNLAAEPPLKCYVFADCPFAARHPGEHCLARRAPIGRFNIGRVRLSYTRTQLLQHLPGPRRRHRRAWRWCVRQSRGSVRAAFTRAGHVFLVATTARGHGNRGVKPGTRSRRFRQAYPHRRRLRRGLYRAGPHSRRLIGLRHGHVRFLAVAPRRLIARKRVLRRYLRLAGL
jgi:triacylglycerol esterase/lipase EstA (alpha/beta hydrolase family)